MGATFWSAAALAAAFCGSACAGAADFGNASDSVDTFAASAAHRRADALVRKMTLDEKLRFIHSQYEMSKVPGGGAGYIQGVPRLGIPDLNMVDSATGSGSTSQASTTFPATLAVAASWDRRLAYDYGAQVAIQLRAQGFGMGLGGGANLAREPRGGRLFEYLGEDPLLAGELLAERTLATQRHKVIATIKHYAGNEQEHGRMGGNSQIDERTLRELYLLPFEIAAKRAQPGSVMCSYNRLNGDYACENAHLLNDVLKNEWGFQGQVQSDWGATHSTAKAINAGLDEEEDVGPSVFLTPAAVKQAIANGSVSTARLDDMVRRKLFVMIRTGVMDDPPKGGGAIDFAAAGRFAQAAAERSIVLLKNDGNQLPLAAAALARIAVIGGHADAAVLSGGGSGNTRDPVTGSFAGCGGLAFGASAGCSWWRNPWLKVDVPIVAAIRALAPAAQVTFAGNSDQQAPFRPYTQQEIDQAAALAARSDVAIVVVAQPAGEDFGDLQSLGLANPSNQDALVDAVARANPHTVVVVQSGNPVLMPWKDRVAAIVEAWYPGEGGGNAIANVLFGKVNPSGRLPVTFPARDQDTPTWKAGGAFDNDPVYAERLNIGYRWYDANNVKPMFEFGYGLSYTHFSYSGLSVSRQRDGSLGVSFTVRNDGPAAGADVPQVYLGVPYKDEPPRRLVGWEKIDLNPGEARRVRITVPPRMQSVWDASRNDWRYVPGGTVFVGASSRDIRLQGR
ncbi:glycoside hydrolase family 3 C-terminal domain-containing protein [Burkholderia ubonensis]|uniref:glycoside hydrolase family 3 C-terminal domain-containing protein n=1 Tax=Burkholderia ubonensis TaxID=101571 RepID=UPI0007574805|nr:glycoside hydrolase family 3 C-terminal domain-containing protein [Burkholderia ubonensis]KVP64595.1 glycosyl hydrolase [Burkholderia ubonensis]KVR61150.1 glycosyl hydrolase [Burkholderia ubonensis]KWI91849.1 glycosyl hydrolase [Burkholderia ubonensis]KWK01944.1 glycosyl hydrolase [Burkholderia ubonensis]KWK12357.1 glycosyl hydrolase [Burkholderia ubonensis]